MKYSAVRRRLTSLTFILLLTCVLLFAFALHTYADTAVPTLEGPAAMTYGDDLTLTLRGDAALAGKDVTFALEGQTEPLATVTADGDGNAVLTVTHPANAADGKVARRIEAGEQTVYVSCEGERLASLTLTVQPRTVTLKDFTVLDRVYDGTAAATATHGGLEGVLTGDTVDPVEGVCFFTNKNVARNERGEPVPKPASAGGYDLSGAHHYNYRLELPAVLTATVFPKEVDVLGLVAVSRPYDGTTDIVLEGGTLDPNDIISHDLSILFTAQITGRLTSPHAGTVSVVLDRVVLTGAAADNYQAVVPAVTAEITPAKLVLSVDRVTVNKGQTIPTLTARVEGFVNGESAEMLEGFALPTVRPAAVNTLQTSLTSFAVTYEGGNATANYAFDRETCATVALEIRTVTATASDYVISVGDLSLWHNVPLTVTPVGDYIGITADATDGTVAPDAVVFLASVLLDREGENTVSFALQRADGTVTEPILLSYKLDTVAPVGNILWRGQSLLADGAPAYRYFSRSAFVLTFTADDGVGHSGVAKVEYATDKDGPFVEITDGTATVADAVGLYTVYYRLTDGAGNVSLLCTDGMVLYADAAVAEPTLQFERLSGRDASVRLALNGNVLAALTNGDAAVDPSLFEMNGEGLLTLKADYLATLAAGEYTLAVTVSPLGQVFAESAVNDVPAVLSLTLTVTRRAPAVSDLILKLPAGTVYDGGEKQVTVTVPDGMGAPTVYYLTADGDVLSVIKNAGTYTVMVDVAQGDDYRAVSALVLGELVISQKIPHAPQLSYQAATGVLSGETAGLVYSFDGETYVPLPESFVGIVSDVCTLYFYLPGDGLNTEDSEVCVLNITRAEAPVVVPADETLFAACDGKLYATVTGLEYRREGDETWHAVEGSFVSNLAPGTYLIRVAAAGTVLESAAVRAVILAAPEFVLTEREATAKDQPAVTLRGELTAGAELLVKALSADPNAASPVRSLSVIDPRTTAVIGFFEPVLNGRYSGGLTVEIAVGEQYNGQRLTVHRETADGGVESTSAVCENGVVVLNVDELSPILVTAPMTTPHGVGSTAWIWVLAVILGVAVAICVAIEIVVRKKKKTAAK